MQQQNEIWTQSVSKAADCLWNQWYFHNFFPTPTPFTHQHRHAKRFRRLNSGTMTRSLVAGTARIRGWKRRGCCGTMTLSQCRLRSLHGMQQLLLPHWSTARHSCRIPVPRRPWWRLQPLGSIPRRHFRSVLRTEQTFFWTALFPHLATFSRTDTLSLALMPRSISLSSQCQWAPRGNP